MSLLGSNSFIFFLVASCFGSSFAASFLLFSINIRYRKRLSWWRITRRYIWMSSTTVPVPYMFEPTRFDIEDVVPVPFPDSSDNDVLQSHSRNDMSWCTCGKSTMMESLLQERRCCNELSVFSVQVPHWVCSGATYLMSTNESQITKGLMCFA